MSTLSTWGPEYEADLAIARERFLLTTLASIATDGLPRVSGYACDNFAREGLIEATGDWRRPYRLTAAGAARLEWAEEVDGNAVLVDEPEGGDFAPTGPDASWGPTEPDLQPTLDLGDLA